MPKRSGAASAFPKIVGPADGQLEMATDHLSEEIDNQFDYLIKKQRRVQSRLSIAMMKQKKRKPVVDGTNSDESTQLHDLLEVMQKCHKLAQLSETRMRNLNAALKLRNDKMIEHMELGKVAIIREVVQSRRTSTNWFASHVMVTPLDGEIAQRQQTYVDDSADILELEKALVEPMDL